MLYQIEAGPGVRRVFDGYQRKGFAAFFSVAVLLFYWGIARLPENAALTGDEIWGATIANLSFFKSIVFTLRYDIHPPLYYMQLNLWALAGKDDLWLQLNSVAWLLAAAAIVWHLVWRKCGDALAATAAAAFVLTSPSLVHYAFAVRMYTFLAFLTVLDLLLLEMLFESFAAKGMASRRRWLAVLLAHVAICYSYATGSIIVAAHFCYGILIAHQLQLPRRLYGRWFGLHVATGVLSLPVVANSMIRQAGHAVLPDAQGIAVSIAEMFAGFQVDQLGPLTLLSVAVLGLGLLGFMAASASSRHLLAAYLLVPMVLVFAASHVLRPLWLTRSFLFAMPVVGVALGYCLGGWLAAPPHGVMGKAGKSIVAAMTGALVCLQAVISYESALVPKEPNYSFLADILRTRARDGDCVTASMDVFWGTARYLAGPEWGDGLQVQAAPVERWAVIIPSIPKGVAAFLGLIPRSDRFDYDGVHVVAGFPSNAADTCRAVFAIGRSKDFAGMPKEITDAAILATSGELTIRGPVVSSVLRH